MEDANNTHSDGQNKQKEKPGDKEKLLESSSSVASFRSFVASSVAPSYDLGYMNITRIKDLYGALKPPSKMDEDPMSTEDLPTIQFPETVSELLALRKDDVSLIPGFKKISERDYDYLCGSLDMLYAVRKMHGSADVPMPQKLKEILTVNESELTQEHSLASGNLDNLSPPGSPVDPQDSKTTADKSHHHSKRDTVPVNTIHNPSPAASSGYSQSSGGPTSPYKQNNQYGSGDHRGFGTYGDQTSQNKHPQPSYDLHQHQGTGPPYPPTTATHSRQTAPSSFSFFKPKPRQPKRVAVTMVSNRINDITDGLLRGFIQSLNTADVVYDVQSVEPQYSDQQQQCVMGCVSASRLLSDVNASMALFTGTKPRQLILVIFHPKAPHVPLHVTTEQKLGTVTDVHAFIDLVFWERQMYSCSVNDQAKANFRRLVGQN